MAAADRSLGERLSWICWLALLAFVPVTSTPLLSQTGGGETPVGPLSLFPLAALLALWFVPQLVRGRSLPGLSKPLLVFAGVAVLSAGAAAFLPILPYKGATAGGREVRALATLAIGLGFYLVASMFPDTTERRRGSLRAIYAGAVVALSWSTVQAWVVLRQPDHVPLIITQIHHVFSVRDPLVDRVTGMAYEPSWLGNQLMVLYVPLLMASAIQQTSVFPWKRGWFSVEAGLLGWCLLILALTKSRISQLSLLVVVSAIMIAIGWRALQLVERRLGLSPSTGRGTKRVLLALTNALVLVVLVAGLVAGAGWAASRVDPRLWALPSIRDRLNDVRYTYPNDVAFALTDRLAFAERLVYWTSAFRTFSLYPLLGVGPGNAGFFFEKTLPDYGLQLIEIQKVIREPATGFPNPKNLWARLLAETGMVGFLAFGFWFVALGAGMLLLWRRGSGLDRVLGLAGSIVFLTQCVEGFSLDSYALPQMWLVLGLGTAALTRSMILTADAGHRPALAGSPTKGASREQAPAESSREGPAPRRLSRAALSSSALADP